MMRSGFCQVASIDFPNKEQFLVTIEQTSGCLHGRINLIIPFHFTVKHYNKDQIGFEPILRIKVE